MKKIPLLLLLLVNFCFSQKQTLFIDNDFETVMQQAKMEKKPVVLMFYATWCTHCNKMKNEVFTNHEVIDFYRKNYICTAIDIESSKGIKLRQKFENQFVVKGFPAFAFFDSNGNLTYCVSGEMKTDSFINEGTANLNPENQLPTVQSRFEKNPENYDYCLAYILMTKRIGFNPTKITQKYLKTVAPNEYYSEKNWRLFSNGITDFDAPEFINMIKNRTKYEKSVSAQRIDKKIAYTINENFNDYIKNKDSVSYKKSRKIAENLNLKSIDSMVFFKDVIFYETTENWKSYHQSLEKNITEFAWNDANFIHSVCSNYLAHITNKNLILKAVNWQKRAIQLNSSTDKYILLSNLFSKIKDYKQAMEYAKKGKQFAESYEFDTSEIDAVIVKLQSMPKQ